MARARSRRYRERNLDDARAVQRAYRERKIAEDREGFLRRQAEAQRRYVAQKKQEAGWSEARREVARMNHKLRRERERGEAVRVKSAPKNASSGVRLPIEPFRAWLERLIEEAKRDARLEGVAPGREDANKRVAALIGVEPRRVYSYLHELADVDESVVDRCVSADGRLSVWDLYPGQLDYEPAQMEMI